MPRHGLPPTPGSSSDIQGKDGGFQLSSLQLAFELPPPAIHDSSRVSPVDLNKSTSNSNQSSAYPSPLTNSRSGYPMQAAEAVKARRRSSAARDAKDDSFALPPPPTRSRKIIQMKPRGQEEHSDTAYAKESGKSTAKGASTSGKGAAAAKDTNKEQGKGKKQPSATSAAGRKIARKTAHSLIERRRRSKMNEEFALLKSMIPACTGEMHKLAILQASIEYVRYLEDCVQKLKDQHGDAQNRSDSSRNALPSISEFHPTFHGDGGDVDMTDSEAATSPVFGARSDYQYHSRHPSVSPALHAQDSRHRQPSQSSIMSNDYHRKPSFTTSANASPAFGPQLHGYNGTSTPTGSALTSPALNPQHDLDQEATAALLMLNNDRRGTSSSNNGRGMSVRDLLTT